MDTVKLLPIERCNCTVPWTGYLPEDSRAVGQAALICDREGCYTKHPVDLSPPTTRTYERRVCVACGMETAAPDGQPHNANCSCIFRRPIDDRPSLIVSREHTQALRDALESPKLATQEPSAHGGRPMTMREIMEAEDPTPERHSVTVELDDNFQIAMPEETTEFPAELPTGPAAGSQDFDGSIDGVGYKGSMDDPTKPPLSLVTRTFTWAVAKVLGHGAVKYSRGNWMRGMSYTEVINGVMRHVTAWASGETYDPDSGENHLAHAACGLMFLLTFQEGPRSSEYNQFDDRLSEFGEEDHRYMDSARW